MIAVILCWAGWHRWSSLGAAQRVCSDCGAVQSLQFYSNRTQEWVTE